jgi:hypothetical protein
MIVGTVYKVLCNPPWTRVYIQNNNDDRDDNIDESVDNLNKLLVDIFEKFSKCESKI